MLKAIVRVITLNRYEAALERKTKILEIIRSLDLPNNPLDDIIDQVNNVPCYNFHDLFIVYGMKYTSRLFKSSQYFAGG